MSHNRTVMMAGTGRDDMGQLDDRICVITGGSHGIGQAIARGFAGEGASVAITYRPDEEWPEDLMARLLTQHRPALAVPMEAGDPASIREAFTEITARLGPPDVLVANAGYAEIAPVTDLTIEQFDRMIDVHLRGTFLCVQAALPAMIARGSGRIITIGSQIAYLGAEGLAHYTAAKAGIIGLTRSLAREVIRHGVHVNCIAPGAVSTGILPGDPASDAELLKRIPIGRFGTVEDIVPTALLLATRGGDFYVGQVLSPNGGEVML
jgi:3-oxoacyl-[acyl-carrier protein] reductase